MFPRLRYGTSLTVFLGMALCSVLFAGSVLVSEASPLLQTAPSLGVASSFAVLGGSTVTNTGATTVRGDLGVSPGSAVTGFPPGTVVGGSIHAADALAGQAQAANTTAYNNLAGQPCTSTLTGDLGGRTLVAGVYCFTSSAQLTGALTLDAQNNASAVFIFKIVSTLTTASGSSVLMTNGGSSCNVYWQVGSSATVGTTTVFMGNILALTSISLTTGARVAGRALAQNGAVTMDSNDVGPALCTVAPTATPTATTPPAAPAPFQPRNPAPTAVLAATATATAIPAATAVATLPPAPAAGTAATSTAITAATATAITAAAASASAATATAVAQTAGVAATSTASAAASAATSTAVAQVAGVAATSTAVAAATATALASSSTASAPATAVAGAAGRAGGLDPVVVAGALGVLAALAIGVGVLRRRRGSA